MNAVLLLLLAIFPMGGAVLCYLAGRHSKRLRDLMVAAVMALELIMALVAAWSALHGETLRLSLPGLCGMGIDLEMDGFRAVYVTIAAFMWFMSNGLFAQDYLSHHYRNRNRYYLFTLLTEGATIGVFLGASLFTAFVFFEMMSMCSYVWVAHDENDAAMRAAGTYLAVAVISGMVTLMGLFMLQNRVGTLMIDQLARYCANYPNKGELYLIGALISVGFAAKAGVFPLHIWLPKAHPVAPAPSSALLSGMLTKTGVFGLIAVTFNILPRDAVWGHVVLGLGVVTMFVGALLALFSVDLKRTLACSSMSQIGFILVGLGMACLLGEHDGLAVHGMLLHMVNHSLIKLVLFMAAGVVYMNLHKLSLNDIRGFGRNKPVLHFAFLMGYLGIIGMPLWNGFVSKSLLHESIVEYAELLIHAGQARWLYTTIEWIFLTTGGMTAAYMTKLYVCLFWDRNDKKTQQAFDGMKKLAPHSVIALSVSALILPILGIFSNQLMQGLANAMQGITHSHGPAEALNYFSTANLIGAAESLLIGAILYLFVVRRLLMKKQDGQVVYLDVWPRWLDLETLVYRPLLEKWLPGLGLLLARVMDSILQPHLVSEILYRISRLMDRIIQPEAIRDALSVIAHAMDDCVDALALGLWNTLFTRHSRHEEILVGNRLTWTVGRALDRIVVLLNRTVRRRNPIKTRFVYLLAAGRDEMNITVKRITLSVSFGLMLLVIGLTCAFVYVLTR